MTRTLRLIATMLLLALTTVGIGGVAGGATSFDARGPSVTGSYLAGSQALFDLRTKDAAGYFRDALVGDWNNPLVVERAFVAFAANGDIADSADTARRLLELNPGNELAHLVIATEALKQRRYGAVIAQLGQSDTQTFAGITGVILRAWAYAGDNRIDEGFRLLDDLGQSGLEDFLVFHRALMADVTGRQDEAIAHAARAYQVDPQVARIVEAYARMLGNAGRFDAAADVIAAFEARGLTHPLVDIVEAAIEERRRPGLFATSVQGGAAEMFHGIGVALARDGSTDLALVFLRLGQYLDPRSDVIALVIGQLLDAAGEHSAANAIYDEVPTTSPLKPIARVRVAENFNAMGDREEAIRRLNNIVRANPDDLEALSVLGDLQRSAEHYAEAAETYTRALELTPGDPASDWLFYYVRGIAYERSDQWPLAEADFKRALELRPGQPQVLNYLGYSWVDKGMHLEEALELIETAVAAAPNDGYIVDSLGWAFYRLGRFEEAVETLELAVRLRPNDAEINDHLGDAYWRVGRQLEAQFQWKIAADVDQEGNVRERVQPKLTGGLEAVSEVVDDAPEELETKLDAL